MKKNKNLLKTITLAIYPAWLLLCVAFFWIPVISEYSAGCVNLSFFFILPFISFVASFLIGKNNYLGKLKWISPLAYGVMFMLGDYLIYKLANSIAFHKINYPDLEHMLTATVIALAGLVIGFAFYIIPKLKNKKSSKNN